MPDRTCQTGKIKYASRSAARKALARHRGTVKAYQCRACHGWHLGHSWAKGAYA